MSADFLDEIDVVSSSRNDGAHFLAGIGVRLKSILLARLLPHLLSLSHSPANSSRMGRITVLYFAAATTALDRTSETFEVPDDGLKLSDLAKLIVSRHPNSGIDRVLERSRWSVDAELADLAGSVVLRGGEEVAVIPPVSGG